MQILILEKYNNLKFTYLNLLLRNDYFLGYRLLTKVKNQSDKR